MPSLHQRAKDLFLAALSHPEHDRSEWLAQVCGSDLDLRAEIESLLAFHSDQRSTDDSEQGTTDGFALPVPGTPRFAPGEVFADRYRMITRLGEGGMGEVWRADDLVLGTPVALKFIYSTNPESRMSVLNEVRLARQITHPAVCRVFDVGEANGEIFLSMELVEGGDLASLLRRVGRLPSEKVIEIARQLSGGLAAAHAVGVLHRDLKPANVMIDREGGVRITDFGIAISASERGRVPPVGTPGYMAPEQLHGAAPLSPRTDLYALGLVLYELVVGDHAFGHAGAHTHPTRPSALIPHVDPQLERLILQMLAPDPQDRPASAGAVAASLPAATVRTAGWKKTWWLVAALAAVVVALLVSPFIRQRGAGGLTERDTVVLADFTNTTGEAVFDGALKVALAVTLEQSPFVKVFPEERVRETLRLMNRSPDEPVTRSIAREIAQREQLKALLSGSIGTLGRNYVLALEAINAQTGDVMAREQVEAAGKEHVLTALGSAATKLREKLGESLASIERFDVPLPRATTASLDALHAYALALDEGRLSPRLEAIPHLKHAIELDPDFALALAQLSGVYANTGQTALAPELARRAFELRDRVSERERFFISWRYYRDGVQAWDKALELARTWTATYPREAFAFNSLGSAYVYLGLYDQAVEPYRHALQLDPKFVPLYSNLGGALMALNRFDEAEAILDEGIRRPINFVGNHRISYLIAFVRGDAAGMSQHFAASIGIGRTNAAYGWQAHVEAFRGRVADAHEQFHRGVTLALQGQFKDVAAHLLIEDAEMHAIAGDCTDVREDVSAGLDLSRDNFSLERASRALAWCDAGPESSRLVAELAERFPEATLTVNVSIPVARAALAMRRGEWSRVLELLDAGKPFDHSAWAEFWPNYLRGLGHLELKNAREARVEFQTILDRRGEAPVSQLYPLAHLGIARASTMMRDTTAARQAYDALLAIWSDADAKLPLLNAARRERARLQ